MNHQAIYNTHPSVASIDGDDPAMAFDVNGNSVVLDESLIATETSRLQTEQANAVAQKAADKQSAHDKLSALGLTDAEIEAIT
jgi:ribosomal silencing factor RsfS